MTHEQQPPRRPRPEDDFGFTDNEQLYDRLSHTRFREIFDDENTNVHRIELSLNSFGEFMFVTLSKANGQTKTPITFYGLGFHEYRERWIHQEWYWYQTHPTMAGRVMDKSEARALLTQREQEVASNVSEETQSRRAQLYEMLADLTDEDGALSELDDLDSFFTQLGDGGEE